MKDMILKAVAAHLNRDPQADALFHEVVVARARQINESIRLGREFVLEDLEKPEEPDLEVDATALLADVDATDTTEDPADEEDDDKFNFDFSDFDADGDGSISQDEFDAEAEHFRQAFAEIEELFANDDDDTDTDEPVKESVTISRATSGDVTITMDDPAEGGDVAPVEVSADVPPVADETNLDVADDSAIEDEVADDGSVDAAVEADEQVKETISAHKRFLESRRAARAARLGK